MAALKGIVNISHPSVHGPACNVWHLRWGGDGAGAALIDGANALEDFYGALTAWTAGGANFSFDGNWQDVESEEVFNEGGTFSVTAGTSAPALPSSTALVVGWGTTGGGRRGKGRTFISPMDVASCAADGTPSAPCLAAFRSAAATLVTASAAIDAGALGVYSREDNVIRDLTSSRVRNVYGVLRSRRD